MDDFDNFINSEIYGKAINSIKNQNNNIEISSEYIKIKQIELNLLSNANITIDDIKNILENEFNKIINFTMLKMEKYIKEKDTGGDFPKNENIGKDDKPVAIKILPFYKSFLVMYFIEYYFLKYKQDKLLQYIKDIRIPQSKKYENELKKYIIK